MAGECDDAILQIDGLIAVRPLDSTFYTVQALLMSPLGIYAPLPWEPVFGDQ